MKTWWHPRWVSQAQRASALDGGRKLGCGSSAWCLPPIRSPSSSASCCIRSAVVTSTSSAPAAHCVVADPLAGTPSSDLGRTAWCAALCLELFRARALVHPTTGRWLRALRLSLRDEMDPAHDRHHRADGSTGPDRFSDARSTGAARRAGPGHDRCSPAPETSSRAMDLGVDRVGPGCHVRPHPADQQ